MIANATPAGHVPAGSPRLNAELPRLDAQAAQLTEQTGTPHHVVQDPNTDSFKVAPQG